MSGWQAGLSVAAVSGSLALACGEDPPGDSCLPELPRAESGECNLQYEPTDFGIVFERTLQRSCGDAGGCHTAEGSEAGLVLVVDADTAYEMLVGDGEGLVRSGDPECSPLMARLESPKSTFQMPPGAPLPEETRCAIIQWIADGAPR